MRRNRIDWSMVGVMVFFGIIMAIMFLMLYIGYTTNGVNP